MIKKARQAIGKLDWWQQLIVYWFGIGLLLVHAWIILSAGLTFNGILWTGILMLIEGIIAFIAFMVDWEMTG
jgi:hypothetical protein